MVSADCLALRHSARKVAGAFSRRLGRTSAAACVLWPGGHGILLHCQGVPQRVAATLTGPAGRYFLEVVRRAGRPVQVATTDLGEDHSSLRVILQADDVWSLALLPFFAEGTVVGFVAVPLARGFEPRSATDSLGWTMEAWGLEFVRLRAALAALRRAASLERRERVELPLGTLATDGDGRVLFADGAFSKLVGQSGGLGTGLHLGDVEAGASLLRVTRSGPMDAQWEEQILPIDSAERGRSVSIARVPLVVEACPNEGSVFLLRDLSSGSRQSEAIDRTLALAMRVAHMADEVRWALLRAGTEREGSAQNQLFAETVLDAGKVVDDVLERWGPATSAAKIDVNGAASVALDRCRKVLAGQGVKLFTFLDPTLPPIPGVRAELQAGIHMLIEGARDALRPTGGTLSVRTWKEETWACIAVSDDGTGRGGSGTLAWSPLFDEDGVLEDPALDGVRRLVGTMGGRLLVERRPKVWSRATIMLPVERRATVDAPRPRESAEVTALTVLLIDDNAAVRSVVRRCLERRGHSVVEAEDGREGLRKIGEHTFDRCIVDVQMPLMTGVEFYECLSAVAPQLQTKIVFMTGGALEAEFERRISESGRPVVKKPFDLFALTQSVEA